MDPETIFKTLKNCRGVTAHRFLNADEKEKIRLMETPENLGVAEALSRAYTLAATHDSAFRKPPAPTVILESDGRTVGKENPITGKFELEPGIHGPHGKYSFPPVPFPELERIAQNVVSSSPSKQVHEYLMGLLELEETAEIATLLIGFDQKLIFL